MADSYGLDLNTFVGGMPGMDPTFGTVSGPPAVVQALARMLMDPVDGIDLTDLVGVAMTNLRRARIVDGVQQVLEREERVESAKVETLTEESPGRWRMQVRGSLGTGPFSMVLAITNVSVELLGGTVG